MSIRIGHNQNVQVDLYPDGTIVLKPVDIISEFEIVRKMYGVGNWRKMKGIAHLRLPSGRVRLAELHWYETHGIGKKEIKRKKYLICLPVASICLKVNVHINAKSIFTKCTTWNARRLSENEIFFSRSRKVEITTTGIQCSISKIIISA